MRRARRADRRPVLLARARRRVQVRFAGAHVRHDGARPRGRGADVARPVPPGPVRQRHVVPRPRHAHCAPAQRLLRRLPDRSPRARRRPERRRLVRPGAGRLQDAGLQRRARECLDEIKNVILLFFLNFFFIVKYKREDYTYIVITYVHDKTSISFERDARDGAGGLRHLLRHEEKMHTKSITT